MIRLTVNGFGPAKEAPLFEFDHETLSYQGKHGRSELYEWDVDKQAWKSLTQIQEVTKPLRLDAHEKLLLTFIDRQGDEVRHEEDDAFVFEPNLQGGLNLVGEGSDRVLARLVTSTREWEVAGQAGLYCPKILFEPLSVSLRALTALRFEPTPRERLSPLAERVLA
jgi:hypothetical protein